MKPRTTLSERDRKALGADHRWTGPRKKAPNEALPRDANLWRLPVWDGRVPDPRMVSL